MKKYCQTDNIDICLNDNDKNNENENDKNNNNDINIHNFYWGANKSIIKIIEQLCINNKCEKVLEIGPGKIPFSLATDFIGSNETITNYTDIDIDKQVFPFMNKHFDFIYCRHVLEDIQNPDFALKEIFRVSKFGGYIETPSPLIEITKDVDATQFSYKYCGYIHHRYIVWSNIQKNEIYFLPKYSCILDHMLNIIDNDKYYMYNLINNYPIYWNNYFIFHSTNLPNVIMYKNGVNFNTNTGTMIEEYINLVNKAVNDSIENTNFFISNYIKLLNK